MTHGRLLFSTFIFVITNAYVIRIEESPRNQTVVDGGIAVFVCTTVGNTNLRFEWRKIPISRLTAIRYTTFDIPNGSVLRIDPVRGARDNATFECIAKDINGDSEPVLLGSANLNVLPEDALPSGFPTFLHSPFARAIASGQTASIQCKVEGQPQPTVTWLKNRIPLSISKDRYSVVNGSLQIKHTTEEDNGYYECFAENSLGSAVSDATVLYVRVRKIPPIFVAHPDHLYVVVNGSNLNLTCIAVGYPIPDVKWFRESVEITQKYQEPTGKNTLILENIKESSNYSCIAKSILGATELISEVRVQGSDDVSPTPQPSTKCTRKCDWLYMKHYEAKNCSPVLEDGCGCPLEFECPDMVTTPTNVCQYRGKIFEIGEKIPTSRICTKCFCRRSRNLPFRVEMSCRPVECPLLLGQLLKKGCYEVFEADNCCSVDVKCLDPESTSQGNSSEPTCDYNGKTYYSGQHIYPEEDPCMICLCNGNWTGVNTESCKIQECLLERKLKYLRRGCLPIYREDKCCPIEFYCGETGVANRSSILNPKSYGYCFFEGKSYSIGEELDVQHPTNCVKCTCRIPPDFTCIYASCPPPLNNGHENCRAFYHEGECCPTYQCSHFV